MTFINKKLNNKIEIVVGKLNLNSNIDKAWSDLSIDFLNAVYLEINKNSSNRKYSDLITFGFWCRKSNLNNLKLNYQNKYKMFGRGNVLHITPSNASMNFAFSLAMGLLSGNSNIVRLPNRVFLQTKILCNIIKKLIKKNNFKSISDRICIIKYKKSDEISSHLSSQVDARIIWGGDETIKQFKKYETKPRCVDLNFSNRYSISLIKTSSKLKLQNRDIKNLALRFYNDAYLMDQQGCSSPQAIIWLGEKENSFKNKFWNELAKIVERKYNSDLSTAGKKISLISESAILSKSKFRTNYKNFKLIRLNLNNPTNEIEKIKCQFGTFVDINLKDLKNLKKIVSKKTQTLTYYGIDPKEVENIIYKYRLNGIDRIVPIGRAFDMGPIWDGYDTITSLSRIIGR